tara:strand:+ start:647 stop:2827 length:2181 start_codon:yes stop_codon:yes gene_type:complete
MSTITAGFDGTNITITSSQGVKKISLGEFNKLPVPPMAPNSNINDAFEVEQQTINFLDTVKDGGGGGNIVQMLNGLGMYGKHSKIGSDTPHGGIGQALNNLEHKMFKKATIEPYLREVAWTKGKKKNNHLGPKLNYENIFYDCGLSPERFVTKGFKVKNTFGKYMDPSVAGTSDSKLPTEQWPEKSSTLEFDESFMELFGFPNSKIRAMTKSSQKYDYKLRADGTNLSWNGLGKDPNYVYFKGNNTKNKILNTKGSPRDLKKAVMMLKEWGDKFQVLTAMVWRHLNPNKTYAVMTNDKVVMLLSTMLKLNCIQYMEKKSADKVKRYTIKVYETSDTPNKDAAKRFNRIKKEITKDNRDNIKRMRNLANNSETPLTVDGQTYPIVLPKSFYDAVLKDMDDISKSLAGNAKKPEDEREPATDIERQIKEMREEYTFDIFIRKIAGRMKILQKKNYTSNISAKPALARAFNLSNNGEKMTFYDIGRRVAVSSGGAPGDQPSNDVQMMEDTHEETEPSWDDTGFYLDPIYSLEEKKTPGPQPGPLEETEWVEVDINQKLLDGVKQAIMGKGMYSKLFDTIYSSVLHWSYVNSGVPLESGDLAQLIFNLPPVKNGLLQDLPTEAELRSVIVPSNVSSPVSAPAVMVKAVSEDRKRRRDEDQPAPPGEGPEKVRKMSPEAESRLRATRKRARTVGGRSTRKNRKIKNIKKRTRRKKRSGRKRKKKRTLRKKH